MAGVIDRVGTVRPTFRLLRAVLFATVVGTAALTGSTAWPAPARAIDICPNCATISVTLSGLGGGTVTDATAGGIHCVDEGGSVAAGSVCVGHYAWSAATPTTQVTLTATPDTETYACDQTTATQVCGLPGVPVSRVFTLGNGQSLYGVFAFFQAPVAYIGAYSSGDGAGSVIDADDPRRLDCAWAAGTSSGTCIGTYVMNPSTSSITVSVAAKPTSDSYACYLDVTPPKCAAAGVAVAADIPLGDGATRPVRFEFVHVTTPTPPPTPPTPTPTPTASPTPRPTASPAPTARPNPTSTATGKTAAPTPTAAPSDTAQAAVATVPAGSPAGSAAAPAPASSPAVAPAATPASAAGGDPWPFVAAGLAVLVLLLAGGLLALGWRVRGRPGGQG